MSTTSQETSTHGNVRFVYVYAADQQLATAPMGNQTLLPDFFVYWTEQLSGPWGPDLLGRAYRAFNWREDTNYLQERRQTLQNFFIKGIELYERDPGVLDIPLDQVTFWLPPVQLAAIAC